MRIGIKIIEKCCTDSLELLTSTEGSEDRDRRNKETFPEYCITEKTLVILKGKLHKTGMTRDDTLSYWAEAITVRKGEENRSRENDKGALDMPRDREDKTNSARKSESGRFIDTRGKSWMVLERHEGGRRK